MQVIAAVSNKNIFHMLNLFINGIKAANISNAMVVALDDATAHWLQERNVHRYHKNLVSRTGSTDNHATSGLKFKILVDFLSIGCSVLLSDVDVIWLANPFPFLYRDTDVEGMTDGWDEPTSYGYDYGQGSYRVFARNSGMFYLQARSSLICSRARPTSPDLAPISPRSRMISPPAGDARVESDDEAARASDGDGGHLGPDRLQRGAVLSRTLQPRHRRRNVACASTPAPRTPARLCLRAISARSPRDLPPSSQA